MIKKSLILLSAFILVSCADSNIYSKKESPSNAFKDYAGHNKSVVGIGSSISARKSKANATISFKGSYSLGEAVNKFARRYSLSVEWEGGVDRLMSKRLTASKQTFNDSRSYLEEVYKVSIVRVRDRAIKVMQPSTVKKLELFNPGPNVRLAEAIRGLSDLCEMNMVIADYKDVLSQEKITTSLKNVSCSQAFEAILDPFGLSLKSRGSHYTIAGLPYKEWSLNIHEQKRDESQSVNYTSEFSGSSGAAEGDSGKFISGGSSETKLSYSRDLWTSLEDDLKELVSKACENSQSMGYEPSVTRTVTTSGDSLENPEVLEKPAQESVSTTERKRPCGYVRVNADVGLVQMQAPRRVIEKADDIIVKLESIATRRLLVEARILAVTKTRSYDRGADLNGVFSTNHAKMGIGFKPSTSIASSLNTLLNTSEGQISGGALGLNIDNLDAVVRFVQSFGTTYQLMKPTLEVMDRQKATIIDGRNEKYFIRTASVDNSGETPVVTTEAEERVQFLGIQFTVSAQVAEDEDGLHTISLQIPITEQSGTVKLENQAGVDENKKPIIMKDIIPIATTRVIDQKVRIRDGDIKVIGGLTRTIAIDKETGVPLLQEVPVAGKAFSEESVSYEDAEFLVLLQVRRLEDQ